MTFEHRFDSPQDKEKTLPPVKKFLSASCLPSWMLEFSKRASCAFFLNWKVKIFWKPIYPNNSIKFF